MTGEARVFICYSTQDKHVAAGVCEQLEAAGIGCWMAPRDIAAGSDWSAAIPPAIDACAAIVIVLSSTSNTSRQVARELHLGHATGRPIVPYRIERVALEGALRYLLSGLHYINALEEPRDASIAELIGVLANVGSMRDPGRDQLWRSPDAESAPSKPQTNVPLEVTSIRGRDADLERLRVEASKTRLLTLSGTGGVGKTRLALAFSRESLGCLADGVWFVDLSSANEAPFDRLGMTMDTVAASATAALSVRAAPGQSPTNALVAHINEKQMLLVFDGCERVRDAAVTLTQAILERCPNVRILATSRQPLEAAGEVVMVAGPLDSAGAMELFIERATAASGTFTVAPDTAETLARICDRLDGIPLAIELAASKMRVIGLRQLDERLGERFRILAGPARGHVGRHQTLRATIDWSFDLLDDRERIMFRRLSIFPGGWTLEAAVAAGAVDGAVDEWDVLDVLASLVDKSLVIAEPFGDDRRYRMLHSIREYALERALEAREFETVAAVCATYVAGVVRDARPLADALEDVLWRERIAVERDNLRAAIETTIFGNDRAELGFGILADLEWPELLTTPQEALRWYEAAVALAESVQRAILYARLLRHVVVLEWLAGRSIAQRERTAVLAVEVANATGDADEIARAYGNLGATYRDDGRFEEAEAAFERAYCKPGRLTRITTNAVLRQRAVADLQRGAVDVARLRFSEVARLERPGSEAHASALLNLGELEFAAGNIEGAREAARRAHETYVRSDSIYLVLLLSNLAAYAMAANDVDDARSYLREALLRKRRSGPAWLATVVEHHALLAALLGDHVRSAVLAGFTEAHYVALGEVRQRTERLGRERLMALLADAFAADVLAHHVASGACLTVDEALAEAAAIHRETKHVAATPAP